MKKIILLALVAALPGCAAHHSVVTESVAYQTVKPAPKPASQDEPLFACAAKYPPIAGVRTAYDSWQLCKQFANANQLAQVNEANLPGSPEQAAYELEKTEIETGTTAEDNEERRKDNVVAAAQIMEAAHPYRLNGLTAAATIANW